MSLKLPLRVNRHPAGRLSNIGFGVLGLVDSLVRIASLGFLHTDLLSMYSRWIAKLSIAKAKAKRGAERNP